MTKRQDLIGKKLNLCSIFVLPMVNINYKTLPDNFVNSYITENADIVIVFDKFANSDNSFQDFLEFTKKNVYYKEYSANDDEIMIIFTIADKHLPNFELFKLGSYSKFSEDYKAKICSFYGKQTIKENYTVTEYNTIYPQEFKRKQIAEVLGVDIKLIEEVLDRPNMDKEIYQSIEQLIEQFNDKSVL